MNEKEAVVQRVINKEKFFFQYLKEGTYYLRALWDKDGNGAWTGGHLLKKIPNEGVFISQAILLKKNWVLEDFFVEVTWGKNLKKTEEKKKE